MPISLSQNVGIRSSGATATLPYGTAVTGGALLTLSVVSPGSSLVGASAVIDSAGNTWSLAVDCHGAGLVSQIWYAPNAAGSTTTITITNATPASAMQCQAQEWSGCSTSSPLLAVSSHASPVASTHTPGPVNPSISTALFLVNYAFETSFDIATDPAGYTPANSTFGAMQTFYKAVSGSTGVENPEAVSSATEISANVIAAFSGGGAFIPTAFLRRRSLTLLGVS